MEGTSRTTSPRIQILILCKNDHRVVARIDTLIDSGPETGRMCAAISVGIEPWALDMADHI